MFQHSNVPAFQQCSVELVITQVDDHVKMRLTSQLINGFSRVLQKLLRYFNGTIISTSFSLPIAGLFSVIFILDLKDSESAKLSFGLSLYYCHKLPDVWDYYINILSIIYLCIISLRQLVNGTQLLNATPLPLSPTFLAAASSPSPAIVFFPFNKDI